MKLELRPPPAGGVLEIVCEEIVVKYLMSRRLKSVYAVFLCLSMLTGLFVLAPETAKAFPDSATFMGVVRDSDSNFVPYSYVKAMLFIGTGEDINWSMTDVSGEYTMNVPGGLEYALFVANGSFYMAMQFAKIAPGETKWVNFTLNPITEAKDVTLKGFVTDELGSPVSNGTVLGIINDPVAGGDGPPYYANVTQPAADGSFEISVIAGAMGGGAVAMDFPGYPMIQNTTDSPLASGYTYWFNLTLRHTTYNDDAMVYGYVTDVDTGAPLELAIVTIEVEKQMGERYTNYTMTNDTGYYEMNVQNGSGRLTVQKIGYTTRIFDSFEILEGSSVQQDAKLKQTLAKIRGNVTDGVTGDPIPFARVFLFDDPNVRENVSIATTNDTGFYELDAFVGTDLYLGAQQDGYSTNATTVNVSANDELWYDFGLLRLTAWLVGNITDARNGSPVQAWMHLNSTAYETWAYVNESGYYNVSLLPGSYSIEVYDWEHEPFVDNVTVADGVETVFDISMIPWISAILTGKVTDMLNGSPIADAEIWAYGPRYGNYTTTNSTGDYEMWLVGGSFTVQCRASGYNENMSTVDAPSMNTTVYDIVLAPMFPPTSTTLNGTVTDESSGLPVSGASVRIKLNGGSYESSTTTNTTGEYEMFVPSWILDVRTTSYQYAPNFTQVNLTGIGTYQLDVQLLPDTFRPNITYLQSPTENVSRANPTHISASVEESYLQFMSLVYLREWNASVSGSNYTILTWKGMSLDPWQPWSNLNWQMIGRDYLVSEMWNATIDGGWMKNATESAYLPSSSSYFGPDLVWGVRGRYSNGTVTGMYGSAVFGYSNGSYLGFALDGGSELIAFDDSSGIFEPETTVAEFVAGSDWPTRWEQRSLGRWHVSDGLAFEFTPAVPSGRYKTEFFVQDWGYQGDGRFVNVTVDNDAPVADPGPAKNANNITAAVLNGSGSTDNVAVVNYTWDFTDGVAYVLYGMEMQHLFATPGIYVVTLTVLDAAGNDNSSTVTVTVNGAPTAHATYSPSNPLAGTLVTFDGTSSVDDDTILYWNWSFNDGGVPVTLSGDTVTYAFITPNQNVEVTLNVTDSAGNSNEYKFTVNVGDVIPEFPTLLMPVVGMMALFALVGLYRRRRDH